MKAKIKTVHTRAGYWWGIMARSFSVSCVASVQHRKTALRQARRVAAKLGLEEGKS